jgi:hypothetical protein
MIKLTKILNEITVNKPKINIISKEEIKTALKHFDKLGFDRIEDAMMAIIEDDDFEKRWDFGNHNNNSSDDAKYFNVIKRWRKQYIKEKGTNWKGLKEIQVNTPTPNINKIKDLIIKLVQNVDYLNMREIYNVLDHYGYGDLIFDDAELYNPDFTRIKNLSKLYNDLKQLQSKLNIDEIKVNKPDTIKYIEWEEAWGSWPDFDDYWLTISSSNIHGRGLFTRSRINKDQIFLDAGTPESIFSSASKINHSSNPNSTLVYSKDPIHNGICYFVKAIRDIEPNEEITINYKTLPSNFDRDTTGFVNEIAVNSPTNKIKAKVTHVSKVGDMILWTRYEMLLCGAAIHGVIDYIDTDEVFIEDIHDEEDSTKIINCLKSRNIPYRIQKDDLIISKNSLIITDSNYTTYGN